MKKIILTAIVILACAVYADETKPGTEWKNKTGRENEKTNVVYKAVNAPVQFKYTWSVGKDPGQNQNPMLTYDSNKNQMWTYERIGENVGWKYEGGTFEFTSDYVWTNFEKQVDDRGGNPGTVIEYGYYTIGADGHANDPVALYIKNTEGNEVENSVIFQKGDKIGIYMTIDEGNGKQPVTFTSTKADIEKPNTSAASPNVDTDSRGTETQYFCLFDNRKKDTGIGNFSHFEYYFDGLIASNGDYNEFIEKVIEQNGGNTNNITDSNGNPISGQPLPGTLATILISGLCAGSLRKRNKNNA